MREWSGVNSLDENVKPQPAIFIIWSLGFQLRTNKATLPYIS